MSKASGVLRMFVIGCTLTLANVAQAVLPDNGWYWNPNESGRGFNIEIQNNSLFMSAFVYDAQGNSIWLVTGGPMSSDRNYSGSVIQTTGGQCIGCPYKAPVAIPYGTATIAFSGPSTATITINGNAVQVQRQQFGLDFSNQATPLLGEWAIVDGETSYPIYGGERIRLSTTQTGGSGLFAAGNRAGMTGVNNIATGSYYAPSGLWSILLDSSTSYYRYYVFTFAAFDRIEGTYYLFLKTENPTTGTPFVAQRIKTGAAAAGQNAPGTGKAFEVTADAKSAAAQLADDEARSVRTNLSTVQAPLEVQAAFRELEALQRARAQ